MPRKYWPHIKNWRSKVREKEVALPPGSDAASRKERIAKGYAFLAPYYAFMHGHANADLRNKVSEIFNMVNHRLEGVGVTAPAKRMRVFHSVLRLHLRVLAYMKRFHEIETIIATNRERRGTVAQKMGRYWKMQKEKQEISHQIHDIEKSPSKELVRLLGEKSAREFWGRGAPVNVFMPHFEWVSRWMDSGRTY